MTTKLEHAARQTLELMDAGSYIPAMRVLREALKPNREGKYYYKDNACTASSADSPDCICWHDEALAEQVEQEPFAWMHPSGGCLSAHYMKEFATGLEKETHTIPLYAAPVRTKDLTDDEIADVIGWALDEFYLADFRAVIAADREKNK